jgi:hypothetical protein
MTSIVHDYDAIAQVLEPDVEVRYEDHKHNVAYRQRWQFREFHERKQRWAIIVAHRRAGKTVATVNELLHAAICEQKLDGRCAYIGPLLNQVKDVAWGLPPRTRRSPDDEPRATAEPGP